MGKKFITSKVDRVFILFCFRLEICYQRYRCIEKKKLWQSVTILYYTQSRVGHVRWYPVGNYAFFSLILIIIRISIYSRSCLVSCHNRGFTHFLPWRLVDVSSGRHQPGRHSGQHSQVCEREEPFACLELRLPPKRAYAYITCYGEYTGNR